jgi:cobalt-zinc-cadmium resistance protein CzcA
VLKSAELNVRQAQALEKSAFDPGKTSLNLSQDPTSGGGNDNSISVSQSFSWPGMYKNQKKVLAGQTQLSEKSGNYAKAEIIRDTKLAYYNYLFSWNTLKVLELQDSIYFNFIKKSELRYKVGETSNLELITARNKYQELRAMKLGAEADLEMQLLAFRQLLNVSGDFLPEHQSLPVLSAPLPDDPAKNSLIDYYRQQAELSRVKVALEQSRAMPDFTVGYGQQLVIRSFDPAGLNRDYSPGTRIAGFQLGIALPIFGGAGRARVNGEKIAAQQAETDYQRVQSQLELQYQQELQKYLKHKSMADYYTAGGLRQADEQTRIAQVSYDLGEIGYIEFIQNMALALQSKLAYLQTLNQLNQSVIQLQFLKGK